MGALRANRWRIPIIGIAWVALPLGLGWFVANQPEPDPSYFLPHAPLGYRARGVKADFTPTEMVWAVPEIKRWACVRAEMAVRYYLRPSLVSGPVCGIEDETEIDGDLIDVTVSGIATVGEVKRRFRVTLEHYPKATGMTNAYTVLSIEVAKP